MRGTGGPRRYVMWLLVYELACLLYYYVPASSRHSTSLFGTLPFGSWQVSGVVLAPAFYVMCIALMCLPYAWLLRELSRRPEGHRDLPRMIWSAALLCATLVFLPSLLSKDLFDYMGHGRLLAAHHANPFITPASTFPADQFTQAMGWPGSTPLYGPAWATACALLALLGGGSFLGTALVFKLFFVALHLANGWMIHHLARLQGRDAVRPARAAAFYLFNPLVLTQTAGDAHNDVVVLFWLLLALWLLARGDTIGSGLAGAMSVVTKYVTAPVMLLAAGHLLRSGRLRTGGMRAVLIFAGAGALVAVVAYAPYMAGFDPGHFLRPYEHSSYQGGIMMLAEMVLVRAMGEENLPGSAVAGLLVRLSQAAALFLGIWYLRLLWRVRTVEDVVTGSTRLLLYYLLGVTALLRTSYLVWIVGTAAIVASAPLRRAVAVFSVSALSLEVFWIYKMAIEGPAPLYDLWRFAASAVAVGAPILYLLSHFKRWPWGRTQSP